MRIEKDFEDLLILFNRHKVRYCIIGSYAVAFYSRPRYTKDIDILIDSSTVNAGRVVNALNDFGFGSLNFSEEDFTNKENIIQLGYEPVRIDILTSLEGLDFEKIWKNLTKGRYGRCKANFIGLSDLIKSKKISNRKQDQADLEHLRKAKINSY